MTNELEILRENLDSPKSLTFKSEQKTKISACGCDTDHYNGEYISTTYLDKRIYFCAESCKEEFLENPEGFLDSDHFVLEFELLEDC